ncbi:hypothetical protein [Actinoallomurus iriomotensis]|uniref:Uncharacterized protein n=1 Tax=Actinoallomurus iriomotensis TaxID=478107 RepID=A0A9W6VWN3_9ACTN|nr:hypothetical protein [Actinoallomurus iriomotensis]GLY80961.1 hypothetical protein Airi01_092280 [Actinoallomurus iriomotensis]
MEETGYDGWADLAAQRRAEDEALVREYAAGEGRGLDMRPVRGFVRHVRRDIGPKGVISRVQMTAKERGHEIVVWYYFPRKGPGAPVPKTATTTRPRLGEAPRPDGDGLAALARPSVTPPASPSRPPSTPATGGTARASG